MAYRKFKMAQLQNDFGIKVQRVKWLDPSTITSIEPSDILKILIKKADLSPLSTEKAISERLISPILTEVLEINSDTIQMFSGEIINADESKGLNGEIDFLFNLQPYSTDPDTPIFSVTEAKIGHLQKAWPQAAAQMLGVSIFNQKNGSPLTTIYGAVTDGNSWQFLKFENNTILVDTHTYLLTELPLLLGIFQSFIDSYK
jgi:hypothetical protein